jgi:hypothetical protein
MRNGRITRDELSGALRDAVAAEITALDERAIDAVGGAAAGTKIDDGSNQSTLGYVDPETTGQHSSSY